MTQREFDVMTMEISVHGREFDPRLSDGKTKHPRAAEMALEESRILDHAARQRRQMAQEHFDTYGDAFPIDPNPKSQTQLREEIAFAEARQRREMLAARGTELLRRGEPDQPGAPIEPELPPERYRPLSADVRREILRQAFDLNAGVGPGVNGRHYFSPSTGRHLGTINNFPPPPPGMTPTVDGLVIVDIPFDTINLGSITFSPGRPVRYS